MNWKSNHIGKTNFKPMIYIYISTVIAIACAMPIHGLLLCHETPNIFYFFPFWYSSRPSVKFAGSMLGSQAAANQGSPFTGGMDPQKQIFLEKQRTYQDELKQQVDIYYKLFNL